MPKLASFFYSRSDSLAEQDTHTKGCLDNTLSVVEGWQGNVSVNCSLGAGHRIFIPFLSLFNEDQNTSLCTEFYKPTLVF